MADWGKILSRGRVEDRRAMGPGAVGGGLGIAGLALVVLFNYFNTGQIDLGSVLNELQNVQVRQDPSFNAADFEGADSYEVFASTVVGSTNDLWGRVFAAQNKTYQEPTLVLFRGGTQSACGGASSQVGPHYCPLDGVIYLDETFFDQLQQLGAQGDVAQAYVIAHEVGHNVQNQLGVLQAEHSQSDSIAVELQADCYAGLWAYSIRDLGIFGPNEIREAIDAAAAVGDDRIQSAYVGRITPETWTHGSSDQRVDAFTRGYTTGEVAACGQ